MPHPRMARVKRAAWLAAAACCVQLSIAASAQAFDLFGIHLFDDGQTATSPDSQTYTITFEVTGGDDSVKSAVQGASQLWTNRKGKPPVSSTVFIQEANAEYAQIVAALRAKGYFGGTVVITVNHQPAETLRADAQLPKPVAIDINVATGPLFHFGAIAIANAPPPLDPASRPGLDLRRTTPEGLGLVTGKPALSDAILKTEIALQDDWKRQGHPKATVMPRDLVANHATSTLDVHIGIAPDGVATFGPTAVSGTQKMDRDFVRRQTALTEGEVWDKDKVSEAEARLRRLQVFSSARVVEDARIAPNGELGVTTQVVERPLYSVGADASYSTLDGPGVGGFWQAHDLFGHAERLRIDGRISSAGADTVNPKELTYLTSITLVIPGILDPYTDLKIQALGQKQVYRTFTQDTIRGRVGLTHEFSQQLTGSIDVDSEYDHVLDAYNRRDLQFNSLPANLTFDSTDDKFEPSKGFRIKFDAEPFYESHLNNAGVVLKPQASTYVSLDADSRYILAGRVALGSILGTPAYDMPADRLFFSGGGQSVRGYRYLSLGPKNIFGQVEGGRSLFETSLEFRAKVTDTIGIVPFVDAGNAFNSTLPDFKTPLKIGAGIGGRYYTSIGAVRVDVAVPVNPSRGDPRFALYLGLGESF
jgi:translocation and assembly module TamA